MWYIQVPAKCGHVGRRHYIVKDFYIEATSGKEAAFKVRYTPRVKHNRKDAILSVEVITKAEYLIGKAVQAEDPYFQVHSSTEQRRCGAVDNDVILPEIEIPKRSKSKNPIYYNKLARIIRRDTQRRLLGEI